MTVPFQAEGRQSKHRNRVTKHLQAFPRQGKTHGGSVSCLRSAAPITEDDCQTSHCNEQSAFLRWRRPAYVNSIEARGELLSCSQKPARKGF